MTSLIRGLTVKETFVTLQGEGSRAGQPAVFVRFAGCNLWSGFEKYRHKGRGECAAWCDTDFATGEPISPRKLVKRVVELSDGWATPFVVLTGGEPMLQLKRGTGQDFLALLESAGVAIAIETNGTIDVGDLYPSVIDHVTVSPKPLVGEEPGVGLPGFDHIVQRRGTDLKVVVPTPFDLDALSGWDFDHWFVQPMDRGEVDGDKPGSHALIGAIKNAERLGWRVSIQTHKYVGLR